MDNLYSHKIVIINVIAVAMQRIDMIYLGGTLKRKKMSRLKKTLERFRLVQSEIAEERLRLYLQKKYHKIEVVDKQHIKKTKGRYVQKVGKQRVSK